MSTLRANQELAQLRADLATVTAEREELQAQLLGKTGLSEGWRKRFERERLAHAETRKALETRTLQRDDAFDSQREAHAALESTRAELAKSEARVKELEHRCLDAWNLLHNLGHSPNLDGSERVVVERWLSDND